MPTVHLRCQFAIKAVKNVLLKASFGFSYSNPRLFCSSVCGVFKKRVFLKRWNLKGQKHTSLHSPVNPRLREKKCGKANWDLKKVILYKWRVFCINASNLPMNLFCNNIYSVRYDYLHSISKFHKQIKIPMW